MVNVCSGCWFIVMVNITSRSTGRMRIQSIHSWRTAVPLSGRSSKPRISCITILIIRMTSGLKWWNDHVKLFNPTFLHLDGISRSSSWITMVSQWGDMTSPWIPQRLSRTLRLWWTTYPALVTMRRVITVMRSLPWDPHSNKTHSVQTIDYITCLSVTLRKSKWSHCLSDRWSDWEKVWFSACEEGISSSEVVHYSCGVLVSVDKCDFNPNLNTDKYKLAKKSRP